jgi:DNA-binding beta-propeller fold protein YncE
VIDREGKYLYMTTGHGQPDGKYWKFALGPDTLVADPISLGYFPATLDLTPDGLYAFAVNFNLHGEMVPSTVSVIYTPTNTEVTQVTTCTMPHGSRVDATGTKQYSGCMMDDQLVEISTETFKVTHRFSVAKGNEHSIDVGDRGGHTPEHKGMKMDPPTCSPTWAQPDVTGTKVFVACNKADEIVEIDTKTWQVTRRFKTGAPAPYNLAVTPDGKLLIATLKKGASTQAFDLGSGQSMMLEKNSTTLANGLAVTPDSRYVFVSSEGVGANPGKVDVYDLRAFARVGSVDVGQQSGGIAFWKMEPVK